MFSSFNLQAKNWANDDWESVDPTKEITFIRSKKIVRALPFILGGYWEWDTAEKLVKTGAFVPVIPSEGVKWTTWRFTEGDTDRIVYKIGGPRLAFQQVALLRVYEALVDKTKLKYVQIDFTGARVDDARAMLVDLRSALPNVVIIAGPAYNVNHADAFSMKGADAVVLSRPPLYDRFTYGVDVDPRKLITEMEGSTTIADFGFSGSREVMKALALGATMVTIGPELGDVVIEDLITALKKTCACTGFKSANDFYPILIE